MAWLSVATVSISSALLTVPLGFAQLQQVCTGPACNWASLHPEDLSVLAQWGLSPVWYAAYVLVLGGLVFLAWVGMGVLLFARGSAEPRTLFFSFCLLLFGGGPSQALAIVQPSWWLLVTAYSALTFSCLGVFLLVFPTGHFVPRWTRWPALIAVLGTLVNSFFPNTSLDPATWPGAVSLLASALLYYGPIIVGQVYRYRWRSTPVERQQTKWVLLALGVFLLLDLVPTFALFGEGRPFWVLLVFATLYQLAILLIPLAIAAAILRYRLWEIDALINKALVYGLLTALLGAFYAGLILGLQALVSIFSGPTGASPLVIVLSTLAIAVLVLPVRRRIQQLIDRRFYRKKYNAEQTLAVFSATLRQEVDLEHLRAHLLAVVQETMQPVHVSLWLRQPERRFTDQAHRLESPAEGSSRPILD